MNEREVRHAMSIDDAYVVEQRLACGPSGVTELVSIDGTGPFVRKRMPLAHVCRGVWAMLGECRCPYLPRVHAMYEMPDEFVVICDYVPGETLLDRVGDQGPLALGEARAVVAQLCEAVGSLHAHGIVHRDVAPANIVLAEDGAHLIDLGSACLLGAEPREESTPMGTWGFAAPEQHGFAPVDVRSDVYGLGRVAAYLLTGVLPEKQACDSPFTHMDDVPQGVAEVLARACAFEPSGRYQSAQELSEAFERACEPGDAARGGAADASSTATDSTGSDEPDMPAGTQSRSKPAASGTPALPISPPPAETLSAASSVPLYRRVIMLSFTAVAVLCALAAIYLLVMRDGSTTERDDAPSTITANKIEGANGLNQNAPEDTEYPRAGASSFTVQGDSSDQAADALKIVDSGWSLDVNGYICYVVAIKNTSDNLRIEFPEITITGRDEDGSIISSDTMVLASIYPGQVQYCSSVAGNGGGASSVDFSLATPDDWAQVGSSIAASTYDVRGASLQSDGFGGLIAVGEVELVTAGDDRAMSSGSVAVTAVVRDDAGAILAGGETYVDIAAEGESATFEVPIFGTAPTGTLEVYARTW